MPRARAFQVQGFDWSMDELEVEPDILNLHQLIFESGYVDNVYAHAKKLLEFLPGITISGKTLSLPLESGEIFQCLFHQILLY